MDAAADVAGVVVVAVADGMVVVCCGDECCADCGDCVCGAGSVAARLGRVVCGSECGEFALDARRGDAGGWAVSQDAQSAVPGDDSAHLRACDPDAAERSDRVRGADLAAGGE